MILSHAREGGRGFVPDAGRDLVFLGLAGVFLALAGAYGTGDSEAWRRLAYWVPILTIGGLLVGITERALRHFGVARQPVAGLTTVLLTSVPISVIAWAFSGVMFGHALALDDVLTVYMSAATICGAWLALLWFVRPEWSETPAAAADRTPLPFMTRAGFRFRLADLHAVRAEDHYVRLYTSVGEALVLMRFADALGQLGGADGLRVHRSWWVSRPAIEDARWRQGRGELRLVDGLVVPVSRAYAPHFRNGPNGQ